MCDEGWRENQVFADDQDEEEEIDISDPGKTIAEDLVVTKYKMAGEIVNRVLKQVTDKCVAGGSVYEICVFGDRLMTEETGKVFKRNKEMKKGIAFPTSVSVDNCICHFSPTPSEPDYVLKTGDLVKVELAGHVDGFIAVAGHTLVVGASPTCRVTGRRADAILAAHFASEAAIRTLKPAARTYDLTEVVQSVAREYKCTPIEGILSFQLKQNKLNSGKRIVLNPREQERKTLPNFDVESHEVYGVEIAISTGEGTARYLNTRTTIYKKADGSYYQLKQKSSRAFFSEVNAKHDAMPFSLRSFQDENKAKLGVVECLKHKIIMPFPVPYEKQGEFVAVFKFTLLLMPVGSHRITGLPFDANIYESEYSYANNPSLKALIGQTVNLKTMKKKKQRLVARGLNRSSCESSPREKMAPRRHAITPQ